MYLKVSPTVQPALLANIRKEKKEHFSLIFCSIINEKRYKTINFKKAKMLVSSRVFNIA
jgi:hypothetical protein